MKVEKYCVPVTITLRQAIEHLDHIAEPDSVLIAVDESGRVQGTLTDGDIRRGLISGCNLEDAIANCLFKSFRFIRQGSHTIRDEAMNFRALNIRLVPVLDEEGTLVKIWDLHSVKSILPVQGVLMSGGRGQRLMPLTKDCPKALIRIGGTPVAEIMLRRFALYGMTNAVLCTGHMSDKIKSYFGDGRSLGLQIEYVTEEKPLGTAGALSLVDHWRHDYLLMTNCDILSDIDFDDFYVSFIQSGALMAVAVIPFQVKVPYAVMELDENLSLSSFKEKPTYTYFSNAGIYLFKKEAVQHIPEGQALDVTDLMQKLRDHGHRIHTYQIRSYWQDIGTREDYEKAGEDIKHLKLY